MWVSDCFLDTFGQSCLKLRSTYNNPIYVKLTEVISAFSRTLKIWATISVSREISTVKVVKIISNQTLLFGSIRGNFIGNLALKQKISDFSYRVPPGKKDWLSPWCKGLQEAAGGPQQWPLAAKVHSVTQDGEKDHYVGNTKNTWFYAF